MLNLDQMNIDELKVLFENVLGNDESLLTLSKQLVPHLFALIDGYEEE